MLRVMIICFVWTYVFDIANTTTSVEEDKINKPHRPIPSNLITIKQSQARWVISWCLAPSALFWFYGGWPAFYIALWQVWVFVFYVWPAYRHCLTKNLMNSGGVVILLRLLNSLHWDIEEWRTSPQPDIAICVWTMATIHLQDFRDVYGDGATHTVTIPLILSPKGRLTVRYATASIVIAGSAMSALWTWMRAQSTSEILIGLLFQIASGVLAFDTITSCSHYEDRVMYRWWMLTGLFVVAHVHHVYLLNRVAYNFG